MGRIRTIKPDFFTSEDIVALSPMARLLFIATWCEADKEGRLLWKPRTLKLRYFPADDCDIESLAQELIDAGLIVPYGDSLAHIPGFLKHQHINPRETASTLPEPDASARVGHASRRVGTRQGNCTDAQGGREGKGKEGDMTRQDASNPPKGRKHSIPADFGISERVTRWAAEKGYTRLPERLERFVSVAKAKGYQYIDWDEAFMNAIRDDWAKFGHASPASRRPEVTLG